MHDERLGVQELTLALTLTLALALTLTLTLPMQHFLLCHEKKLQLFGFGGKREREWTLDAEIRYVKVTGGPSP